MELDQKEEQIKKLYELTDTGLFLLPCYKRSLKDWKNFGFINCYLSDINREKVNDKDIHLYLLFKPNPEAQLVVGLGGYKTMEKESQLIRLQALIESFEELDKDKLVLLEDYDYEGGYVVLVFRLPEKWRKDYNKFLKGHYSLFSEEFKKTMPETIRTEFVNEFNKIEKLSGKSLQYMIINKSEKLKEYQENKYQIDLSEADEYYHKIIVKEETLNISKFNNINND